MSFKIIVDSVCDTTPEIRERLNLTVVPLGIKLSSGREYIDDLELDIHSMIEDMHKSSDVKTNCPSVIDYAKHMYQHDECFVVTAAGFISGSFNSAVAARDLVLEEFPDKKIHIFDSLSASAGELRFALYIGELVESGCTFEEIVAKGELFAENMATIFVLENLENLIKNGRMSRLAERVASILGIYPVLFKRKVREIRMGAKVRGLKNAFERMIVYISEWTKNKASRSLVLTLSHCEAAERAEKMKERILETCDAIKEVIIAPASGVSSVYANSGGIVVGFEADSV